MKNQLFIFVFFLLCLLPNTLYAAKINPFGGKIIATVPCTCSAGFMVVVIGPRPGSFLFQPFVSQLYGTFTPFPGANTLGTYATGGACVTGVPPYCVTIAVLGTVIKMGTSLPSF